uniref:Uncharacterized protein n=1 Tax=Arundo donax TaxID=35708 RepID=A0A0A9AX86_ARUDO
MDIPLVTLVLIPQLLVLLQIWMPGSRTVK